MLDCEIFRTLCVFIVIVQFLRLLFGILYNYVIGPYMQISPNLKTLGKWAVITGATDGIGKAYAEALASKQINVILISRTMKKLKVLAEEIVQQFNVETKVIEADFTNTTDTYQHIEKNLNGYEIGILVNNVGLSYDYPQYFLDMNAADDKIDTNIINCNILSVTNMTKIVLPSMVSRKMGVIINISSLSSKIPSPMLTVYAATKAYVDKFSCNLSTEYSKHGIYIQNVTPGFVATKMSKIKKASWMAPTPELYVKHALNTIGIQENTCGYYPHSLLCAITNSVEYISDKFARNKILGFMENMRNKALKKQNKETS